MSKAASGRIVGVFGLPCSGKTTIIKALTESSKEILAHIISGDIARKLSTDKEIEHMAEGNLYPFEDLLRAEIMTLINKRRSSGAEIVFLDGFPRIADQVQWMLDNQYAGTLVEGCFIKVIGDKLEERAQYRNRDDQDSIVPIKKKMINQDKDINIMEKIIFSFGVPYFTIMNTDLEQATKHMAKIVCLRK